MAAITFPHRRRVVVVIAWVARGTIFTGRILEHFGRIDRWTTYFTSTRLPEQVLSDIPVWVISKNRIVAKAPSANLLLIIPWLIFWLIIIMFIASSRYICRLPMFCWSAGYLVISYDGTWDTYAYHKTWWSNCGLMNLRVNTPWADKCNGGSGT